MQIHFQPVDEWSNEALKHKVAIICIYQVLWELPVAWLCCDTEVEANGKCVHGVAKDSHCGACEAVIRDILNDIRQMHPEQRRQEYDDLCPQQ